MSKVALVTGASRGIGKEVALNLADDGFKVVVNYVSNQAAADEVVTAIKAKGGEAIAIKADISSFNESEKMIEDTVKAFGGLDVLVNNAGITRDNLLIRMSEDEWNAVLNTNYAGIVRLTEKALEYISKSPNGRVINLTSTVGVHGNAGQANYAAAKSALISYTKIKARELMPKVRVNAIAPGLVKTDMTSKFNLEQLSETKLGRPAFPIDIALCVKWLAGPGGGYITGQVFEIDGGLFLFSDVESLATS
jgi:3-oxoacyl-[acyl-carrier protein] reductase